MQFIRDEMTELFDTTYMMDYPEDSEKDTLLTLHNSSIHPQLEYNLQANVPTVQVHH